MKKFLMIVAVAAVAMLADSQVASAKRGGCGGGRGGRHGGCSSSCGGHHGGCGTCGAGHHGGCGTCGGGYVMGGGGCAGGICSIGGTPALAFSSGTEATLVVSLPEDASLTID